jgi:hypothetical protein
MNPADLTVYTSPYPKIRIGKDYDGGYVIANIPDIAYSCLISGGISNDISFEEEFNQRYPTPCYAFDGTINALPKESSIQFTKKNIGATNDSSTTNLHDLLDSNDTIFVKMDIEGHEFAWLKSLNQEQMDKISQIVIEFHYPFNQDILNKFSNHVLIHFHGNNCCGTRYFKGTEIPNVFECTFIHKKYVDKRVENVEPVPSALDMRNLPNKPELNLNFPPFVANKRKTIGVINGRRFIWNTPISKS